MATGNGRILWGSHFVGANGSAAVLGPDIQAFGVNTETYAATVDEPGGILALGTGGSDDDNAVLRAGPFRPADGAIVMEARYKYSNVDCAVFCGFTETLDTTTPVMPAEFATATMTYQGSGGMVGIQYDADGTTDDFRAVMGDAGAGSGGSGTTGVRANATLTADRWFITRVILNVDGTAEVWHADVGHISNNYPAMRLIKRFTAGVTPGDLFFACLMIENRSGNARTLEVDYFNGEAFIDWNPA